MSVSRESHWFATSLLLSFGGYSEASGLANQIVQHIREMPEPTSWDVISALWSDLDDTPGKRYKLVTGGEAVAEGVGPQGELVALKDGERLTILAAEALFPA